MTAQGVMCMTRSRALWLIVFLCLPVIAVFAQEHNHTPAVSGVPQGVPLFCENPRVTSIATGAWSDARTWSTGRVAGANDKAKIAAGHTVTVGGENDAKLQCIQVD